MKTDVTSEQHLKNLLVILFEWNNYEEVVWEYARTYCIMSGLITRGDGAEPNARNELRISESFPEVFSGGHL